MLLLSRTSVLIACALLGLSLATAARAGSASLPSVEELGAQSGLRLGPPAFDDKPEQPTASAGTTTAPAAPESDSDAAEPASRK
jgi:hypothetical protein